MSVYKRGAHINLLYLSPFPSMRIKGTKVSFERQRKRELTVDVDTVTNTRVAIRHFSRIQTMVVAREGKPKQNTKRRNAREAAAPGYASSWRGIQGYRWNEQDSRAARPCQWTAEIALTRKEIRDCPGLDNGRSSSYRECSGVMT